MLGEKSKTFLRLAEEDEGGAELEGEEGVRAGFGGHGGAGDVAEGGERCEDLGELERTAREVLYDEAYSAEAVEVEPAEEGEIDGFGEGRDEGVGGEGGVG